MKKILGIIIGILVVVGLFYFNQPREVKHNNKETIKIGIILPLTGASAYTGNIYKELYDMRLAEIPQNSKFNYKVIFSDDELNSQKSLTAANKLLYLDNVDVMFLSFSGAEPAISDLAKKQNKLAFSLLWDTDTPYQNDHAFNALPLPDQFVSPLLQELQKRGYKRVSVLLGNHRTGLNSLKILKNEAPKYGLEIVDEQFVDLNERDFRILVNKMELKKPDIIISLLFPSNMLMWVRTLKEQGITTPITSIDGFDLLEDKSLLEGVWYVSDSISNPEFERRYKEKYGKDLSFTQALWAYEALNNLINIYETFDTKPTDEQLIQALYKKRHNTVVGDVYYDGNGILNGYGVMKIIHNGKSEIMKGQ
ncbi:MAG: ABC transporter substrate-binding protein [Alphaproteobacteria bacterium]|nr:ABC transporter substrate-binding protein [Alphaproteobacteria bacterium]